MTNIFKLSKTLLVALFFTVNFAHAIDIDRESVEQLIEVEPGTPGKILIPTPNCVQLLATSVKSPKEVEVYSVAEVSKRLEKYKKAAAGTKAHAGLIAFYENMIQRGGTRLVMGAPAPEGFTELANRAPNHKEVIADLKRMAALHRDYNEPMQITPILLLGEPGVGKTHFAMQLANIIGTELDIMSMGAMTAGWIVAGASSQWDGGRAGKVASALIDGWYANPVMVVDEIDKTGRPEKYDPLGAIYSLMEQDSAQIFKDEYAEIPMNASHVIWIATANNASGIPDPILNRMDVYVIPKPTPEESRVIGREIYQSLLAKHSSWVFDQEPSNDVLDKLSGVAPRVMRKALLDAFGYGHAEKRRALRPEDVNLKKATEKARIGFVQ